MQCADKGGGRAAREVAVCEGVEEAQGPRDVEAAQVLRAPGGGEVGVGRADYAGDAGVGKGPGVA